MQAYEMNKVEFAFDDEADAFPTIEPGVVPFGSRVLCQIRRAKTRTKGGIILAEETRDTEMWNTQVAKIRALGPLAFHNRSTGEPWPEGKWVEVGDYVRAPKYGGDRWSVRDANGEEVIFVLFNDLDLLGKISGDPLAMKAFL